MKISLLVALLLLIKVTYAQELMLYGGQDHDVYLGCFNCSNYDNNSIWNNYGTYGSRYNTSSIWDAYGEYGGEYSDYSPFNKYASYPPVIVDKDGNFYGYLTANTSNAKRANSQLAILICDDFESISKDPSKWYTDNVK